MSNLSEPKPYPLDMNEQERTALEGFVKGGLLGISSVKEDQIKNALQLYLDGASYQEISIRLGIKKYFITYLSWRHDWFLLKQDMLSEMMGNIREKTSIAHLKSLDFLTELMSSIESHYRPVFANYRSTKDPRILNSIDEEKIKLYMKCMDQLQKTMRMNNDGDGDSPSKGFGLNLPNGGILRKIDDRTVEVSPLDQSADTAQKVDNKLGEVLSHLAELRRIRETKEK